MRITPGIFSPRRVDALKRRLRVLANLYVERTKLTLADRLALLMGAIVLVFVCLLLGTIGLVFISGALIELFSMCLHPIAAWFIVGGIYLVLLILTVLLRRWLIFNPVAKFVSKLIFKDDSLDEISATEHGNETERHNNA